MNGFCKSWRMCLTRSRTSAFPSDCSSYAPLARRSHVSVAWAPDNVTEHLSEHSRRLLPEPRLLPLASLLLMADAAVIGAPAACGVRTHPCRSATANRCFAGLPSALLCQTFQDGKELRQRCLARCGSRTRLSLMGSETRNLAGRCAFYKRPLDGISACSTPLPYSLRTKLLAHAESSPRWRA